MLTKIDLNHEDRKYFLGGGRGLGVFQQEPSLFSSFYSPMLTSVDFCPDCDHGHEAATTAPETLSPEGIWKAGKEAKRQAAALA